MTKTYSLAPIPFWYLPDGSGKPLGSGKMFTYNSLNLTEYKPVFQDSGGTIPWSQPIDFDLNGTSGPFYWEFDDAKPSEFYFLQIYDSNNNLVYQINNFPGPTSSGGGTVTTNINLKNYIVNNAFLYNQGNSSGIIGPSISNGTIISPGAHSQFYTPDIIFFNTNPGAVDTITFNKFNLGSNPLIGDVSSLYYLNYTSNAFVETKKGIQFPINPNVNTLQDQLMTFSLWAQSIGAGSNTLDIYIIQYFGTGSGASPTNEFKAGTLTLTNSWSRNIINFTVPNVSIFTRGNTGDDGTYLQIRFPTDSSCNINIAKPSLYLGSNFPISDFESDEQIESLLETPRTSDIKSFFNIPSLIPKGWIYMNDGSIGNGLSGATNRANIDTWFLFNTLWNAIPSLPVSGGRGGSSVSDWNSNKSISLPFSLNRVISNAYSASGHPLGFSDGFDINALNSTQVPNHTHDDPSGHVFLVSGNSFGLNQAGPPNVTTSTITGGVSGTSGQPFSILQPTTYATYMIKL